MVVFSLIIIFRTKCLIILVFKFLHRFLFKILQIFIKKKKKLRMGLEKYIDIRIQVLTSGTKKNTCISRRRNDTFVVYIQSCISNLIAYVYDDVRVSSVKFSIILLRHRNRIKVLKKIHLYFINLVCWRITSRFEYF